MKRDVYLEVTNTIVRQLESGLDSKGKWNRPWKMIPGQSSVPVSIDGRTYRGLNFWLLMLAAADKGYDSNVWGTYKAWAKKGGQIRTGEKSTMVVLWKPVEYKDADKDGNETTKKGMYCRAFSVFNIAQQDGFEFPNSDAGKEYEPHDKLAEYLNRQIIPLEHKGDRAFYSPSADKIVMPPAKSFETETKYTATLAHECIHSTGHKSRLDRKIENNRFGDSAYAFEELVAELGATMFCAIEGLQQPDNLDEEHAKYIKTWIKVLKDDKKAIFTAASKAQKACDMVLGIQAKASTENEQKEAA